MSGLLGNRYRCASCGALAAQKELPGACARCGASSFVPATRRA